MTARISIFFEAWTIKDEQTRLAKISKVVAETIEYDDPRTPETLKGITALSDYLGIFSANAPGWTAKVIKSDRIGKFTRATVSFNGMGPDGKEKVQLGQYFSENDGDLITRMVGFVGAE